MVYAKHTWYSFEVHGVVFETDWVEPASFEAVQANTRGDDGEVRFQARAGAVAPDGRRTAWYLDEDGADNLRCYSDTSPEAVVAFLNKHGGPPCEWVMG
jgi:hypothetical protein